jgi:hypothetical protein
MHICFAIFALRASAMTFSSGAEDYLCGFAALDEAKIC